MEPTTHRQTANLHVTEGLVSVQIPPAVPAAGAPSLPGGGVYLAAPNIRIPIVLAASRWRQQSLFSGDKGWLTADGARGVLPVGTGGLVIRTFGVDAGVCVTR